MLIKKLTLDLVGEIKKDRPTLKILNLSNNAIEKIEYLENLTCLENLNMSGNQILSMNGLNGLKNLTYIDLSNNQIAT
jgi:Leucine-rich repeat (LRR) protein